MANRKQQSTHHSFPVLAEERATLAVIQRARGLRGEVISRMLTDFPDRFDALTDVWLTSPTGETRLVRLESTWMHKGALILKFEGIDTMTAAETLAGYKIQIPLSGRVPLEEGEFFIDTLIGCRVELPDASCLGEVVAVASMGGGDTLIIRPIGADQTQSGVEYLVPFVHSICPEVDVNQRLIRLTPPEGLFEQ